jgi:hypothetical protein
MTSQSVLQHIDEPAAREGVEAVRRFIDRVAASSDSESMKHVLLARGEVLLREAWRIEDIMKRRREAQ